MPARPLAALGIATALALALAGCVANNVAPSSQLQVAITDDGCAVSATSAPSGTVAFTLTNTGSDVNEFEILAEDKLRIVGEKENVPPGQSVSLVAQLEPGTYYTGCKFQQVGSTVGQAEFTVTGGAISVDETSTQLTTTAVNNYIAYVSSQVQELIPTVAKFTAAYESGDDATARALFATTRAHYERIEPTAEAFGDLDPKIDYREVDAAAEGLSWTGFHRIEKDLWPPAAGALNSDGTSAVLNWTPSTPAERTTFGEGLVANVRQLSDLVNAKSFSVTLADISNGAIGLLDEVAKSKITGEEDWWSHTDLTDFQANVQGAEVAFGNVKAIAASKGPAGTKLVASITKEFAALDALLTRYGSIESGFTPYNQVTDAQRKELSDQVNALAEPLSQLTHTVLGVAAG
ncbi:MAG: EfeM/EfeO family lipoprotein [Actinomycetota bacterium]|nr:EfeM/EfeO family lipoprotein [Actinomycetota bacterium]